MNLADLVLVHRDQHAESLAISQSSRQISYREYAEQAGLLAAALLTKGVEPGDRVLFFSFNSPEYLITYTACAWIGAIFTPVHHSFKAQELGYIAENSQARLAIVDSAVYDEYVASCNLVPGLPRDILVVGSVPDGQAEVGVTVTLLNEAISAESAAPPVADVDSRTPVLISYTSGSTSRPKPVLRSHGGEIWNAQTYVRGWDIRRNDRALVSLPLSWVYGLSTISQPVLAAGGTIELLTHFNPVRALETIEATRATLFAGTNTMYTKLLSVHDKQGGDLSTLRNCYIGGEPSNATTVARFEALVGSRLLQGYAATEAAPAVLVDPIRDAEAPTNTIGRLVPGAELKLASADGEAVSTGEPGEALIRCPGAMIEYFREPELTATRVTSDGWFRTGDLLVEQDGYYFVVGRMIDMIIRGGSNIAPAEVESALTDVAGIADAVVFGLPDADYGERVAAVIVTEPGSARSDEEIVEALGERLARFKIPTTFIRVDELPDGRTGKRDRRAIRDHALSLSVLDQV